MRPLATRPIWRFICFPYIYCRFAFRAHAILFTSSCVWRHHAPQRLYSLSHRDTRYDLAHRGVLLTALLIALFERERPLFRKTRRRSYHRRNRACRRFLCDQRYKLCEEKVPCSRVFRYLITEQTTKSRFQIWGMAIEGFKENPLLGWGQDNFNLVFNKYYDSRLYDQEPFFDRAHNVFLDWLIAGGIVGSSRTSRSLPPRFSISGEEGTTRFQ